MTLRLSGRSLLAVAGMLAGFLALAAPVAAADWCDVPELAISARGQLVIGEYGIFRSDQPCPPLAERLAQATPYRAGSRVFMWFRLEGDEDYLNLPQAQQDIRVYFKRKGSFHTASEYLDLGNARIEHDSAAAEAAGKGGRFDWRFNIEFRALVVPGTYILALSQADVPICLRGGQCDLTIEFQENAER